MQSRPRKNKSKRPKVRSVVSTPLAAPLASASASSSGWPTTIRSAAVHAVSSLKRTLDGSLKLVSHRLVASEEKASQKVAEKRQTLEQVISEFIQQSEAHGWDEGYMDSFLGDTQNFGTSDPDIEEERPKRETGKGVSCCMGMFRFMVDRKRRTKLCIDGPKTLMVSCSH